ncbi:MAG: hypothetical protein LBC69_01695 [Eubacteriaceae bacterium]|nr:hypothetical protein [Eubacteriaceae bacterium]
MVISRLGQILKERGIPYEDLLDETGVDLFSLEDVYNGNVPLNKEDWGFSWDDLGEILTFLAIPMDALFEASPADPTVTSVVFRDNYKEFDISARVNRDNGEAFGFLLTGKMQYAMAPMGGGSVFEAQAIVRTKKGSVNAELLVETLKGLSPEHQKVFMDEIEYVLVDQILEYSELDLADVAVDWTGELAEIARGVQGHEDLDREFYDFLHRAAGYMNGRGESGWRGGGMDVYDAFFHSLFPDPEEGEDDDE